MPEPFNINVIPLTGEGSLDLVKRLYVDRNKEFLIELSDGPVVITGRWLCLNIFLWRPLVKRGYPVSKRHSVLSGLVTKEVLAEVQTEIYNDVIDINRVVGTPVTASIESDILYDLMETYDHAHRWISTQLGEYHLSISAFEMCDLLDNPEIQALTHVDISKELEISIEAAEAKLKQQGDAIMELLKDSSLKNNIIAPFLNLGLLSVQQLPQVVMALGFRTDASDQIVRYPITSSYIEGMKDIKDFAVESLAAKKTIYYNRNAMPDSQYDNRKQQILASTVRRLYPGDCGRILPVPFYVHAKNHKYVIGKNIVTKEGELLQITSKNSESFVGSTIYMRSPLTCLHTDGTCHACGGRLTDFMHPDIVIGIASTVEYMSAASQLVLSAKHFSKTSAITYKIPEQLGEILIIKQNDIFIRNDIDVSKLKIKVAFWDVAHINDLKSNEEDEEDNTGIIGEQQFSSIHHMTFVDMNDVPLTAEIPMDSDGTIPYFSSELLIYMKENFRNIKIGDEIIIPLKKFKHTTEPILRCVIESSSMIKFNSNLEKFVTTDVKKYTSLAEVLAEFTGMVHKEIKTNVMHLEIVLKSYLITDEDNFNIPVVEDVDNVKFESLKAIIPRRSLGQQFSYQELLRYLGDPATYVLPHPRGLFDNFFYADA